MAEGGLNRFRVDPVRPTSPSAPLRILCPAIRQFDAAVGGETGGTKRLGSETGCGKRK